MAEKKKTKKKEQIVDDVESLDAEIEKAQERLREMGLEREVWLKKPLFHDPSYHLCFTTLEDDQGLIMLQQIAGESLRLLDAPGFLKKSGAMQLKELIEFAPLAQVESSDEGEDEQGKREN